MGITAENLAEKYQITREDCDNYAYQTQQKWKAGRTGFFDVFSFYGLLILHIITLKYTQKRDQYFGSQEVSARVEFILSS